LSQHGLAGRTARAALLQEGEEIAHQEVNLSADGGTEVSFEISRPGSGLYAFDVRVDPIGDEVTELNNSATQLLRVVDEPIRVRLLEGKPYWDARFLVRTLAADSSIELVSIVRMSEGRLLERALSSHTAESPAVDGEPGGDRGEALAAETAADQHSGTVAT